jgi:hypothetical protein
MATQRRAPLETPLHRAARMRAMVGVGIALVVCGCAETDAEVDARSPVRDHFPEQFALAQQSEPPAQRPRSISLGYIGDAPLGTQPTPPHHEPYWTRPFPCHWTNTCWAIPPPYPAPYAVPSPYAMPPPVPYPAAPYPAPYAPPAVGVYAQPPMEGE